MPELATAWVTISANTQDMEKDLKRAINRAERSAKISPEVDIDTSDVAQQGRKAGNEFARRFES